MTAPIAGSSTQAAMRYARAAQDAAAEAARSGSASAGTARVRTRSFGLKLGGFGLTYTAEDVRVEPSDTSSVSSASVSSASFRASLDRSLETASLRSEMVQSAASATLSDLPAQRRSGLRAYRNALAPDTGSASRTLLAVA